jgi:DNA-binding GntR family transcriptional regulator
VDIPPPRPQPLSRTFLVESAYDAILGNILSGALPAGSIISEVALAKDLNVSRTPVHQALARLAKEGLVEVRSGRKPQVSRFGREDLIEIYDIRLLLESAAAQRAAKRLDPKQLSELRREAEHLEVEQDGPEWARRALELGSRFQDALAAACGNRRLSQELRKYRLLVRASCGRMDSPENLREELREHQQVLKALADRHPAQAGQAMAQHIQKRLEAVLGTFKREAK